MEAARRVLHTLADGRWHKLAALSQLLSIDGAQVQAALDYLCSLGLNIDTQRKGECRVPHLPSILNQEQILGLLPGTLLDRVRLAVCLSTDSTNRLASDGEINRHSLAVYVAEHQSMGRGRRGRAWVSPIAANLYFSLATSVSVDLELMGWLSLGAGIAIARSLKFLGYSGVRLKWPNDVVVRIDGQVRKLGGVLTQISNASDDARHVVIGCGINVEMPPDEGGAIDQPWTDLRSLDSTRQCDRNQLVARLVVELDQMLATLAAGNTAQMQDQFEGLNIYQGQAVSILDGQEPVLGEMRGVDAHGRLILDVAGAQKVFATGEISMRAAEENV